MSKPQSPPPRWIVLALALGGHADTRTADKALRYGVAGIKGEALRDRLVTAAAEIGVTLPLSTSAGEKP